MAKQQQQGTHHYRMAVVGQQRLGHLPVSGAPPGRRELGRRFSCQLSQFGQPSFSRLQQQLSMALE
jgi:hypothetical protein